MSQYLPTSVFRVADHVVSCELEGGDALLDLEKGQYYSLNMTASVVWNCVSESYEFETIVKTIMDRFDVDEGRCSDDVSAIIKSFLDAGLIKTKVSSGS